MFPQFDKLLDSDFDQNARLLSDAGVSDSAAATESLGRLHDAYQNCQIAEPANRDPAWYQTLKRILQEAPLPDRVIRTLDEFVTKSASPEAAFQLFENRPRSLAILARLACGSMFLTQTLLNHPSALNELTAERRTAEMKSRDGFLHEAQTAAIHRETLTEKLTVLRHYQRREILRIGMCDAFGLMDLKFVTLQISLLADAMVQACLILVSEEAQLQKAPFSVLALGKLGGEELNYSSDIDLILIDDNANATAQRIARRLIDALSESLASGFLYRVDMRLRPWGDAGPLVNTPDAYERYLRNDAELWEKQALLKARVIAGQQNTGHDFLTRIPDVLFEVSSDEVFDSIRRMKGNIEGRLLKAGKLSSEIKLGAGSIRDIEFLVQALQLTHGKAEPRVASPGTLDALVRLAEFGILDATEYRQLREGYIFLRTIEHALQLLHNLQTHELPDDPEQRRWLARRLDYPDEFVLISRYNEHRRAVLAIFNRYFRPTADVALSLVEELAAAGSEQHPPDQLTPQPILEELKGRVERTVLMTELQQAIKRGSAEDVRRALNLFKDRHLQRIDVRHVQSPGKAFGSFSKEVTELAEVVVEMACQIAWQQLAQKHGQPIGDSGHECSFTLAALGKFGGVEMGFASDIEMYAVFEEDGQTNGAAPVSTARFFEKLVNQITQLIESRNKGIFEIDLRMRPYGQAGSSAVSLRTFREYFSPSGDAWPYERQSLVKLRCIGGDSMFADQLIGTRDELIYCGRAFDFDAMRAMREKQIRQLVRGGTINAKLSDGGLVDCEYSVQALQMTFGDQHQTLRTANTLKALTAAQAVGILTPIEQSRIQVAYIFLRQVIDCLRMVRGNAQDLTVPDAHSTDHFQLTRRLDEVHDSKIPLRDLEQQMQHVRLFSHRVEEICKQET